MPMAPSNSGFLLLDGDLNLIASNEPAVQILCFPTDLSRIRQSKLLLSDRIRTNLIDPHRQQGRVFVSEFQSGKRRYVCKMFPLNANGNGNSVLRPVYALLLERTAAGSLNSIELSERFGLTQRECETVEYLLQGLTSKEIAVRMNISPNTVKAFLRLVMVKMRVSTRSGIAGKLTGARSPA